MFVPSDRQRFLAKLPEVSAEAVVLDLEDGAGDDVETARTNVASWIGRAGSVPAELYVRTHEVDHDAFEKDVRTAVGPGLAGLILPKVASGAQVRRAAEIMASVAAASTVGSPVPGLVVIIESAAGLAALPSILAASDQIAAVAFGAEDFSADLGIAPLAPGEERQVRSGILDHARARIAIECAAAGIDLRIDTPSLDLESDEHLVREAQHALRFGFGAKFLIHPKQVAPLHEALRPSDEQIAWANEVLAAAPSGAGAVRVRGRMVDEAVLRQARNVLLRVEADS